MSKLLLGIDIGTYSSKGVLVEPDGNIVRSQVLEHTMSIPRPGWVEQDADEVWWQDVVNICKSLLDGNSYKGEDVSVVAVSAIGPCMLPLDKNGRPLRPGILYGIDTRAGEELDQLNNIIGSENIFRFSGMALSSQAVGPKILWMRRNEPEIWKKVEHITTASSYVIYKLTGEKVIDRHTASHYIPLMDIKKLEWSDKYAEDLIESDKLPRLRWSDEIAGEVSSTGASDTGLRAGTPVAVGAVDALSEAVSVGAINTGDLMIMYGSTTFFILVLDEPVPDKRLWNVAGAFEGQYNLAAGMATTGSLTRWFRDQLAKDLSEESAYNTLFSQAEKVEPGAGGLLVLPYFSGERTPLNDPKARGIIAGLTLSHTREQMYRGVLEGVAYGIRHNIETFQSNGAGVKRIIAVGGGTKSKSWPQIVSDVTGISQIVPEKTIGASYGDAFLAGVAAGILKRSDIKNWVKIKDNILTNQNAKEKYDSYFADYLNLYKQTKDIVHRLEN